MGMFDKVKNLANKNKDKIASGVDKATDVADQKTGGKHTDHLEKVDDAARKYAGDTADTTPGTTGTGTGTEAPDTDNRA